MKSSKKISLGLFFIYLFLYIINALKENYSVLSLFHESNTPLGASIIHSNEQTVEMLNFRREQPYQFKVLIHTIPGLGQS